MCDEVGDVIDCELVLGVVVFLCDFGYVVNDVCGFVLGECGGVFFVEL